MKKTTLSIYIFLSFFFSVSINAQAMQEALRAEFLTSYYENYQSNFNNRIDSETFFDSSTTNTFLKEKTYKDEAEKSVNSLDKKKIKTIEANCIRSLQNDNDGVVESAIFVSIQYKNRFPSENVSSFIGALDEIATEAKDPRMSYKAELAKIYLNNTEWFDNIEIDSIERENKIFEKIAERISTKMFPSDF